MSALIQRAFGSASISTALASSVQGSARIAPSGPRTQAQKSRERKLTVGITPIASPATLGWITDCSTKFSTE